MKILLNYADYLATPERKKQNTYGGVGYYRTINIAKQIEGHNVKVIGKEIMHFGSNIEEQWDNVFKEYDVYWTSYFADDRAGAAIFYHANKHGKKVIIDIDDNYLDVPESNLQYEKFQSGKRDRAMLSTILSFADALTVSTEPLKQRLFEHIKKVHGIEKPIYVLPNCNDIKDWDFEPAPKHADRVTIGYTGSNSHQDDLQMIMPAIKKIMEKHKNVWFETIGVVDKKKLNVYFEGMNDDCLNRCGLLPATATFKEYPEWLAEQKWDIGIAPLVDTSFTRSKSHIKFLEYSVYKIPTVASRVYPYFMELCNTEVIEDGETGFLCKPKEWFNVLDKLVTDKKLRERIGENAYEHVKENWQYDKVFPRQVVKDMLNKL
jgi:glycosyltransferase involved in cell wall biosynthesis